MEPTKMTWEELLAAYKKALDQVPMSERRMRQIDDENEARRNEGYNGPIQWQDMKDL